MHLKHIFTTFTLCILWNAIAQGADPISEGELSIEGAPAQKMKVVQRSHDTVILKSQSDQAVFLRLKKSKGGTEFVLLRDQGANRMSPVLHGKLLPAKKGGVAVPKKLVTHLDDILGTAPGLSPEITKKLGLKMGDTSYDLSAPEVPDSDPPPGSRSGFEPPISKEESGWRVSPGTPGSFDIGDLSSWIIHQEENKPRYPGLVDGDGGITIQNGDTSFFGRLQVLEPTSNELGGIEVTDSFTGAQWVRALTAGFQKNVYEHNGFSVNVQAAYTINEIPKELMVDYGTATDGVALGFQITFGKSE